MLIPTILCNTSFQHYYTTPHFNNIMQHLIPTLLRMYATPHPNTTTYVCNTSFQHYYVCMQHLIPTILRNASFLLCNTSFLLCNTSFLRLLSRRWSLQQREKALSLFPTQPGVILVLWTTLEKNSKWQY